MKYQLTITGYGRDQGAGQITQAQYDYWSDKDEDELSEALNDNYEYVDEDGEPLSDAEVDKIKLTYYNEYEEYFVGGADLDGCHITITDETGTQVFAGDYGQYQEKYDPDCEHVVYECDEVYYSDFKPGFYVIWGQGAKGTFTDLEFETDLPFDGTKLRIGYTDWEGQSVITALSYDGEDFDTYEGLDNWGKWAEYEVRDLT